MGWVYMSHPGSDGGPTRFPDDPEVIRAQEVRGWEQADDPGQAPSAAPVEPDEVDGRGQAWVLMRHAETGGEHRFPVEVVDDQRSRGWEAVTVLAAAEKKKPSKKKTEPTAVDGETEKES